MHNCCSSGILHLEPMKYFPLVITFWLAAALAPAAYAQSNKDTLFFKAGNLMIGEIKSLDRGVVTIETNYSDKDFAVEWTKVKSLRSSSQFLITLSNGQRITGTLYAQELTDTVHIIGVSGKVTTDQSFYVPVRQIVYLKGLKESFISRMRASVDAGLNLTKANNLRQFNAKIALGYTGNHMTFDAYGQALTSIQDSVERTQRLDGGISSQYFLPKDWFLSMGINFLANTEQAIKLRTTGKVGIGKYVMHTNRKYWSAGSGLNINNENFSNQTSSRNSLEFFAASELNLFDIGDLNFLANAFVYRSLTENKRWRSDIKIDLKYDLPRDFYIKFGGTVNYDNRPAIPGNETDFILTFGVGWELD